MRNVAQAFPYRPLNLKPNCIVSKLPPPTTTGAGVLLKCRRSLFLGLSSAGPKTEEPCAIYETKRPRKSLRNLTDRLVSFAPSYLIRTWLQDIQYISLLRFSSPSSGIAVLYFSGSMLDLALSYLFASTCVTRYVLQSALHHKYLIVYSLASCFIANHAPFSLSAANCRNCRPRGSYCCCLGLQALICCRRHCPQDPTSASDRCRRRPDQAHNASQLLCLDRRLAPRSQSYSKHKTSSPAR